MTCQLEGQRTVTGQAGSNARAWDRASLGKVLDVPDRAQRVRTMFDAIVDRYELVNTLTTLGLDRSWRERLVRRMRPVGSDRVLDVACGTGQMLRAFRAAGVAAGNLCGIDFSRAMLAAARRAGPNGVRFVQADALRLPIGDARFDAVTCVFGVRNFADVQSGLQEMLRVLRPGGSIGILEFGMPRGAILAKLYRFYFCDILPRMACWISRDRTGAYAYLPRSVVAFDEMIDLGEMFRRLGCERIRVLPLGLGIVQMWLAQSPLGV